MDKDAYETLKKNRKTPFEQEKLRKVYNTKRWRTLRQQIIDRDNMTCAVCGTITDRKLVVDHINPITQEDLDTDNWEVIWNPNNLRLLCVEPTT